MTGDVPELGGKIFVNEKKPHEGIQDSAGGSLKVEALGVESSNVER
jgi:hypothetical protein